MHPSVHPIRESENAGNASHEADFFDVIRDNHEEYYNRLCRSVKAYTYGSGLDPEDIVQDTFLKAVKSSEQFKSNSSVYTWLFRIARNTCIDQLRKQKSQKNSGELTDFDDNLHGPEHVDAVERRESKRLVREAVKMLEPSYRELIVMKDLEQMKYAEISDITGINEGTIKSRLFKARVLLKDNLQKLGYRP